MWYNRGNKIVVSRNAANTPRLIHLLGDAPMNTVPHYASNGNPQTYTIYALVDPRTFVTRYIGMTNNVYRRYFQHVNQQDGNHVKDAWIDELKQAQAVLIMQTLEQVEDLATARERETYWIQHYLHLNAPLTNALSTPKGSVTYNGHGMGRKCSAREIDDILDHYLLTGELPTNVSTRQRRSYKSHPRLNERRLVLQASGKLRKGK